MLTLFTTAKPFTGHIEVIQRNAISSWKVLHPDIEIILFGDEPGSERVAQELRVSYEPKVERNRFGTYRLDAIFSRAQEISRHRMLCYVNCDIILTSDFVEAAQRLLTWSEKFLMIGRRWDTDITKPVCFSDDNWEVDLVRLARETGCQRPAYNIDYFLFTKELFRNLPPFGIGRLAWDNYLVWHARELGVAVVDASEVVCAIHQNHDYGHYPGGFKGLWDGEEAKVNLQLAGNGSHRRTIADAQYRLRRSGVRQNFGYQWAPLSRWVREWKLTSRRWLQKRVWHPALNTTRPLRQALGLRQSAVPRWLRSKKRRHWMDVS